MLVLDCNVGLSIPELTVSHQQLLILYPEVYAAWLRSKRNLIEARERLFESASTPLAGPSTSARAAKRRHSSKDVADEYGLGCPRRSIRIALKDSAIG